MSYEEVHVLDKNTNTRWNICKKIIEYVIFKIKICTKYNLCGRFYFEGTVLVAILPSN